MASDSSPSPSPEKKITGTPVSPGIARGEVAIHWIEQEEVPHRTLSPEEIPAEIARFETALVATREQLLEMQQKIAQAIGTNDASIFDAHLLVVEDRTLIDEVLRSVETDRVNVEYAFDAVARRYCKSLSEIDDPYLRERVVDIEDVAHRVIRNLLGKLDGDLSQLEKPQIVVAHSLSPGDTALINRSFVLAFVTEGGSKTSHAAIMARSLGIPAIVGLPDICSLARPGDHVLVDGYRGFFILNPSEETLREYEAYEQEKDLVEEKLELIRDTASTTIDGHHIILSANIELPGEASEVAGVGAEGVGLFRTEFLFLNRDEPPDEDEQFEAYREVAERCMPHGVIVRTLDIGGDKTFAGLDLTPEANPFLGCRAIRFCLEHPEIFKAQLRAILRASVHGKVRLMYPMVSGLGELRQANAVLDECREELRAAQLPFDEALQVGIMVEVPSAALSADLIASEVDFFSIGTNDLIQYAIAVDRVNERITHLYKPTHPAILRLIQMVVRAAHDKGIWVGVCGEMAADVLLTPLLVGLDIDELSTSPSVVPRVKKAVQSLDHQVCRALAEKAMTLCTSNEILALCTEAAKSHYGELIN